MCFFAENMYLGPPSTAFSSSGSSGAPPRPEFRTVPAFGAGFRRNSDVLKAIGHFRAGVTDVIGQGVTGGDAQAFYMLRPFDLTGKCVWGVWGCVCVLVRVCLCGCV